MPSISMRKNGKNWHATKTRFTPSSTALTSYAQRSAQKEHMKKNKVKVAELKAEKDADRQRRIAAIKGKKERKEERERWAKMEDTMHRKKVERRKRKEKRNKLLKS